MIGKAESQAMSETGTPLAWAPCFIESQFPVAKLSMESYKERCAKQSQTLTGIGKWWGRKPLVLIRAALLGILMPASDDYVKDREIFLKLMTMDDHGLWRRKDKSIPYKRLIEGLVQMPPSVQESFLNPDASQNEPQLRTDFTREERFELQRLVFQRMSYSERLKYCCRPEQIKGPSEEAWEEINAHLGTDATSLPELVEDLGIRRFGHRPWVGDSFCGAGSVPFEATRLGCHAYGSDLSPVAALLTWAALNIVSGGEEVAERIKDAQKEIFAAVDQQVTDWGIEHNELGWRADIYLYCVEVLDPESGWLVPLAPSWIIGEKNPTIAQLIPDENNKCYEIDILENVSIQEMKAARDNGTVRNSRLVPPHGGPTTSIEMLRRNLRLWENDDLIPRPEDVFQERLYCIRWVETYYEMKQDNEVMEFTKKEAESLTNFDDLLDGGQLKEKTRRHYRAPTKADLKREEKVLELLQERFHEWQAKGYIPSRKIEPGYNTTQPMRERGWTKWHHLFNPHQLLNIGLILQRIDNSRSSLQGKVSFLTGLSRCADYNSRLSRWHPRKIGDKSEQVFSNQALNTLYNYAARGLKNLEPPFYLIFHPELIQADSVISPLDARMIDYRCDLWITDPPYADAINYHELSEFFLAWYQNQLSELFPDWYTDSKRALAVKGNDESFRQSMGDCYKRLVDYMPDNGLQVVMFTHQDAAVWADLTMILWAAGLSVTAAWCIATETDSALKQGNYVQGTVLMILRQRTEKEPVFIDEIVHRVEAEVKRQLDSMLTMDDESDPNFGDADYQLAAYAAALRVLTERPIEEIDPSKEILRHRKPGEVNPVEQLIRNAVKIACDHVVPRSIENDIWKSLSSTERFYLKGLEVESHGEYRNGVYQELARGFGATDYTSLLASTRANQTRLKTAGEFGRRMLSGEGFPRSLIRQLLFAVHQVAKNEQTRDGLNWLRTELRDYWTIREKIINLLDYISSLGRISVMSHWRKDAEAAELLSGSVRNDHV